MSEPEYPKRDQFFAHKFVRMLTKDAVANELGSDACWLLTVIALQEDAKRYRSPVTFYTHQLAVLCGCENDKKLARIRDRIVKAGWLMYLPGGKGVPGRYWCIVPDRASDITDGPCDEGGREPGENRERTGNETGDKREESGKKASSIRELTNLSPNPTPDPVPKKKDARFARPDLPEVESYAKERDSPTDPAAFYDYYESVGWKVSNKPMKDWKATFRNWERRDAKHGSNLFGNKTARSTADANNDAGAEYLRRKAAELAGSEAGEFIGAESDCYP